MPGEYTLDLQFFVGILACLGVLYIILGKISANSVHTQEDYFLSGRALGFFSFTTTCLATQLGGAALLGSAEEAFQHGWTGILYTAGVACGFFVLALGIGSKIREKEVSTVPELFEKVFNSPFLRQIAGLVSVASLFLIFVAQAVATRKFFAAIGFEGRELFYIFWLIIITYTVIGGLKAVINTDKVQVFFILGSFLGVVWVTAQNHPGFLTQALESTQLNSIADSGVPWMGWIVLPMLFTVIGQDMGQRCSAAISPKIVSFSMFTAALIYIAFAFIPVGLGLIAAQQGMTIPEGHSVLITAVATLTNPKMTAIAACGLMMAIISTADSLLCAISANVAQDFSIIRRLSEEREVMAAKLITLMMGILGITLSFALDGVIPLLIKAIEPSIFILFSPILLSLLFKRPPAAAAYTAVFVGAAGYGLSYLVSFPVAKELLIISSSFVCGALVCFKAGSLSCSEKLA